MVAGTDINSVPDGVLNAYLWPLGAWGIALLFLYASGNTVVSLTLCYPLALWFAGLTFWWVLRTERRYRGGLLEASEVKAGVRSVCRILAAASVTPGLVFLAMDPLSTSTWGTCGSVAIVTAIAWTLANTMPRLGRRATYLLAIAFAWSSLPLNATGAITLAMWLGWFEGVRGAVGV